MTTQADRPRFVRLSAIALALVFCHPDSAPAQTTHDVQVGDNFFSPANLTIEVGDTVRWTNAAGGIPHDVTEVNFAWASVTASSFVFERTFNSVEEVDYFCKVHPATMGGSVSVIQGAGGVADLSLEHVDALDGTYAPGDLLQIDVEVQNLGDGDAEGFTVNFFASTDDTVTEDDTPIGSENRSALAAGMSDLFVSTPALPENLEDGTYYIGAFTILDDSNDNNTGNMDNTPITVETAMATVDFNAGFNDAWRNPEKLGGQGVFMVFFPVIKFIFLSWFTYDLIQPDAMSPLRLAIRDTDGTPHSDPTRET
jgi:plastocyanin